MTSNKEMIAEVVAGFMSNGINGLRESLERLFNELMVAEREQFVNAAPYERTDQRKAYCNGFKDKKLLTKNGELHLRVPQVRDESFYPSCLEKGERTEQALKLVFAEAYIQGVGTRKMKQLAEELCGKEISATQVSRCSQILDEEIEKFRSRPLGQIEYLFLDAQYEKIRHEGCVRSLAILKAIGVNTQGYREVLGISCSLSEAEVHWREFLTDLCTRGMTGVKLVTSDNHAGLRAALRNVMPSVPWQRCIFHLAQNAASHSPSKALKKELCDSVRKLYQAEDLAEAEQRLKKTIDQYSDSAGDFCEWLDENFREGLTFFNFPKNHWKRIRTVNVVERMNKEQKRRTRIASLFPNIASCQRLVSRIAMDIHEDWVTGKKYLEIN